jgi:hypothetical protein
MVDPLAEDKRYTFATITKYFLRLEKKVAKRKKTVEKF